MRSGNLPESDETRLAEPRWKAMRFLDWFRRPPAITDRHALAAFIDSQAAFLMQKGIYEYSRARAGHYAKVMFGEQQFTDAFNLARWQAYPLGLAMVGELVDGVLRGLGNTDPKAVSAWVRDLVLSVFDSHPVPPQIGAQAWREARADLALRLEHAGLHPPKRAMDIPEPLAKAYFNLMPIHEKLRGRDFPTTHNYLKVTMCNIHAELTQRMDAQALSQLLPRTAPAA
jgi:hypothetical protein